MAISLKRALAALLGAAVALPTIAAPSFQLADLQQIVRLSEPALSPDGRQVALVVSRPDVKSNQARLELDLVDVATGARRVLSWQRSGLSSPLWSPDGTRLAFLALDGKEGMPQIFVMPMNGGDAQRISEAERGVEAFSWSPDGGSIAYTTPDEAANAAAIRAHDDAFRVTDNNYLARAALTPSHLWVVASGGGTARRLSAGEFSLQIDQAPPAAPAWSVDGHRLAVSRFPGPYWATAYRSVGATVAAQGGALEEAVSAQGATHLLYSPDGKRLAYQRPRGGDLSNGTAVYVQAGGQTHDASAALARDIDNYAWLDAGTLLLSAVSGTRPALWEQPVHGTPRQLELGEVLPSGDLSVSARGGIAFIGGTRQNPGELYVIERRGAKPRRLTHLNDYTEGLALGGSETVEWQGPDGFHEDGVLTYPPDYQKGQKYPLVLFLHGGPQGSSVQGFFPLQQLLAAAGFLVFEPNYRGSNNLGDAYQHAVYRDTAEGPGQDVMAGLAALQQRGIVDERRIGVSGWSYGGFMTAWLAARYPSVWKAAVAGATMTDWTMDNALSHFQDGDLFYFGSSPWTLEGREIWRAQSPISIAHQVKAPTLILGDVGDPNVPLTNSYAWFHALRHAGVQVEFYAYPVDTHLPRDIVRKTDAYRRWVGWMAEHLK